MRAVFLDRDGVLNRLVIDAQTGRPESPLRPEDVALLPGAAAAVRRAQDGGYLVIGVSNQPAAAKGHVPLERLEAVQARVLELLEMAGAVPDGFRICFHHPEGTTPPLGGRCDCRKPAPGLLLQAAEDHNLDLAASWMIGDTDADVAAGAAAGCRTILIENPDSKHKRLSTVTPLATAPNLGAAVDLMLSFVRG
jgi:D-glycero-D-manno-heptose 1,7-bisphosphate phosphatase